jgi:hypothetical protein
MLRVLHRCDADEVERQDSERPAGCDFRPHADTRDDRNGRKGTEEVEVLVENNLRAEVRRVVPSAWADTSHRT